MLLGGVSEPTSDHHFRVVFCIVKSQPFARACADSICICSIGIGSTADMAPEALGSKGENRVKMDVGSIADLRGSASPLFKAFVKRTLDPVFVGKTDEETYAKVSRRGLREREEFNLLCYPNEVEMLYHDWNSRFTIVSNVV